MFPLRFAMESDGVVRPNNDVTITEVVILDIWISTKLHKLYRNVIKANKEE